jgi:hypothetical protein
MLTNPDTQQRTCSEPAGSLREAHAQPLHRAQFGHRGLIVGQADRAHQRAAEGRRGQLLQLLREGRFERLRMLR